MIMETEKIMIDVIGEAAMYEQFAEECVELAHAALKMARLLRGDNPPRNMSHRDCRKKIEEEFTDVFFCVRELDLKVDTDVLKEKEERFLKNAKAIREKQILKAWREEFYKDNKDYGKDKSLSDWMYETLYTKPTI